MTIALQMWGQREHYSTFESFPNKVYKSIALKLFRNLVEQVEVQSIEKHHRKRYGFKPDRPTNKCGFLTISPYTSQSNVLNAWCSNTCLALRDDVHNCICLALPFSTLVEHKSAGRMHKILWCITTATIHIHKGNERLSQVFMRIKTRHQTLALRTA